MYFCFFCGVSLGFTVTLYYVVVLISCIMGPAHPSVICTVWPPNWKMKWHRKTEIGMIVFQGRSNECVIFQFIRSGLR